MHSLAYNNCTQRTGVESYVGEHVYYRAQTARNANGPRQVLHRILQLLSDEVQIVPGQDARLCDMHCVECQERGAPAVVRPETAVEGKRNLARSEIATLPDAFERLMISYNMCNSCAWMFSVTQSCMITDVHQSRAVRSRWQ